MNYQHLYHAGNFADVFKHSLLALLIHSLHKKEAPLVFIDTHAGAGCYDLAAEEAQKTGEYRSGVEKLCAYFGPEWPNPQPAQTYSASGLANSRSVDSAIQGQNKRIALPELEPYLAIIHARPKNVYPGSPEIAYALRRPQDRLILNEKHPLVNQQLRKHFEEAVGVSIHQRDAYEFLPAILPPEQKRGVVLIDPPFERPEEWQNINTCLHKALKRWATGIYLVWSPITGHTPAHAERTTLQGITQPILKLEWLVSPLIPNLSGLVGCRYWIINPPFQFESGARVLIKHLHALNHA